MSSINSRWDSRGGSLSLDFSSKVDVLWISIDLSDRILLAVIEFHFDRNISSHINNLRVFIKAF